MSAPRPPDRPLAAAFGAELLATFGFVALSAGAVVAADLDGEPLAAALVTGLAFATMVTASAPASGGHLNPAVTLAMWAVREVGTQRAATYVGAQILGAVLGALSLRALLPGFVYAGAVGGTPELSPVIGPVRGMWIEALATFLVVLVYLATMLAGRGIGSRRAGALAVGLVLTCVVLVFGPFSGAAVNPARWFGPAFAAQRWDDWPVWIAGPLVGALVAAVAYRSVLAEGRRRATP